MSTLGNSHIYIYISCPREEARKNDADSGEGEGAPDAPVEIDKEGGKGGRSVPAAAAIGLDAKTVTLPTEGNVQKE